MTDATHDERVDELIAAVQPIFEAFETASFDDSNPLLLPPAILLEQPVAVRLYSAIAAINNESGEED